MAKSETASGGIGITGLLFVLFVGLKLTGYIDWSWWWVTAPLWGPALLFVAVVLGIVAIAAVAQLVSKLVSK